MRLNINWIYYGEYFKTIKRRWVTYRLINIKHNGNRRRWWSVALGSNLLCCTSTTIHFYKKKSWSWCLDQLLRTSINFTRYLSPPTSNKYKVSLSTKGRTNHLVFWSLLKFEPETSWLSNTSFITRPHPWDPWLSIFFYYIIELFIPLINT